MEDILDVYKRPYDEKRPLVCMDELNKQMIREIRCPLPAREGDILKYDTEYERHGTCNTNYQKYISRELRPFSGCARGDQVL